MYRINHIQLASFHCHFSTAYNTHKLSPIKYFQCVVGSWKNSQRPLKRNLVTEVKSHWFATFATCEKVSSIRPCTGRQIYCTNLKMGKTALVIIAAGSEEIEAVTPIDTLRRAGVEVTVAGLCAAGDTVMSRNVIVGAEKSLTDALTSAPYDAIILPGGAKGSEAFVESATIGEILKEQEKAGRLIAAICAAPTALHKHDICLRKAVTSYPSMKDKMIVGDKYQYKDERVVIDGNLITSRGPGTSLEFSLAVAAYLVGQEKADEVGKAMLVQ